jgi:DNA repair protein RadC
VAHNHPSGNKKPSENDRIVTVRIKEAANYMDLILLDHLILVPDEEFYCMVDNGII